MTEKLTGDALHRAVEEANAEGAEIDPFDRADDKRAALQDFYDDSGDDPGEDQDDQTDDQTDDQEESDMTEQPEASQDDEVQENDPVADGIAKHGETPQEELDAQRDAVLGTVTGADRGPSQDDLNPAYAVEKVDDEDDEDDEDPSQ